jgi:uncharacterized protein YgiM (DUF1202 family)
MYATSPTADPLRIAQKGEKLRVIGRESKWVQVTDPTTSETGWVYSRSTEPAPSPAQKGVAHHARGPAWPHLPSEIGPRRKAPFRKDPHYG